MNEHDIVVIACRTVGHDFGDRKPDYVNLGPATCPLCGTTRTIDRKTGARHYEYPPRPTEES